MNRYKQEALSKGKAAERSVAHIVKGSITSLSNGQLDDIDVVSKKGTYSVKDVKRKTKQLGIFAGLPMENKLFVSTNEEDCICGWLHTSKAEWFVFRVWMDGKDQLIFFSKEKALDYIKQNLASLKRTTLNNSSVTYNQKQNRKYDQSECIIIPLLNIKKDWTLNVDYWLHDYVKID